MTTYHIHALSGDDLSRHIDALCEVLENCVSGGASVSFMHPLSREKSLRFWSNVAASTSICNAAGSASGRSRVMRLCRKEM